MKVIFHLLFFIIVCSSSFSQNFTADSLKIESLFSQLTSGNNNESSFIALHKLQQRNRTNDSVLEIYDYYFSKYLMLTGKMDSSIFVSENALEKFTDGKNRTHQIKFLKLIASCYAYSQNYQKGIEYFKQALVICEITKNEKEASYINNNIANLFFSLMDYESAYKYSSASFNYLQNHIEDPYYGTILAILSMAETKVNKNNEADKHAKEALEIATKTNNILALIVSNHALGEIESESENFPKAIRWFSTSLKISVQYHQTHFSLLNHIGLLTAYLGSH